MKTSEAKGVVAWVLILLFAAAIIVAAVTACGSDTKNADDQDQTSAGQVLDLAEADNGADFTVDVGDTITVVLVGNPTTGYEWAEDLSTEASALLKMVGEPMYDPDEVAEGMVGTGGKFTVTFTAAVAGQAELKLKYWRSFEPDAAPMESFTANITVR